MTATLIPELLDLSSRTAIVTGAGQGFGFAIAARLAEAGADVVLVDREHDRAVVAAEKLVASGAGGTITPAGSDVSDEGDVMRLFDGREDVDVLVNNAGVFSNAMAWDLDVAEFDRIHRVNVRGGFLCARQFARVVRARRGSGVVVNIASVDALNPSCEGQVHYTSSKHAVAGLTKALSVELAPIGIRVNAVCPGAAMTEGAVELVQAGARAGIDLAEQWAGIADRTPLRRLIDPDDVALATLFLVSDMAASITGILLPVDGGILAQPLEGYVGDHS
jgi:2-deoxy-D-gluconate 3-dehydrogenase